LSKVVKSCKKLSKSCQKVVKKVVKKCSKKLSNSCQIYQKVGCKKTKILKRLGEEEEGGKEGEEGDV
jgi:mRNA-degrading endonuclease RelE of RelBE toxin-antitoxin system